MQLKWKLDLPRQYYSMGRICIKDFWGVKYLHTMRTQLIRAQKSVGHSVPKIKSLINDKYYSTAINWAIPSSSNTSNGHIPQ